MNLRYVKSSSRFVVSFFVFTFIFQLLITLLFASFGFELESIVGQIVVVLIPYLLSYYFGYIIFFKQYKIDLKKELDIKKIKISKVLIDLIVGYLVIFLVNVIQNSIISFFATDSVSLNMDMNAISFIQLCFLAPILEELIFRGCIFKVLSKYNKVVAVLISATLFSLMHTNYYQLIPTFVMGIVFCLINEKNKSLLPSIFLHIINNVLAVTNFLNGINECLVLIVVFMSIFSIIYFMVYLKQNNIKIRNNIVPSLKLSFRSVSFIILILLNILIFYLTIIGNYEGLY